MASGWILEKVRRKGVHALHFPFGRVACDGAWVEMGRRWGGLSSKSSSASALSSTEETVRSMSLKLKAAATDSRKKLDL